VNVGFIGLGMMGNPMARNLLKAGHKLVVFDLNPEAVQKCADRGATVATALPDMASCRIIFIIVNTGAQLNEVLFGDNGLVASLADGDKRILVVMSTISPMLIKDIQQRISNSDITLVDAPVSGGPIIAELGQLSFMIGGADSESMKVLRPYLEAMGKDIFTVDGLGSGLAVKLINNIVALGNAYVFTEALAIGAEANLDIERVVEIMSASSGKNWCTDNWEMYKAFLGLILAEPSFQQTAEKDIDTAIEWSADLGLDIPTLQHVRAIVKLSAGIPDQLKARLFSTNDATA
jgi:3-hydroxyisobutyrate dehydrogenase-like beta-hydroxyacid dehydrogenase